MGQRRTWVGWREALLFCLLNSAAASAPVSPPPAEVRRDFWSYDRAEWGDRPDMEPVAKGGKIEHGGWMEYDVEVAADAWYELILEDPLPAVHELLLDGRPLYRGQWTEEDLVSRRGVRPAHVKILNLPLAAGPHVLRLQRLGEDAVPYGMPKAWILKPSGDAPERRVAAELAGFGVVRVGETLDLKVTGGRGAEAAYMLIRQNLVSPTNEPLTRFSFRAGGDFSVRNLKIPCDAEGVYRLRLEVADRLQPAWAFRVPDYVVIDTRAVPELDEQEGRTLIHDIDCVTQTNMGLGIRPGSYVEASGGTRIRASVAGLYRESHDGRGPDVEPATTPGAMASGFFGFSYALSVPDRDAPYLVEVDYPDDDWRDMRITFFEFDGKDRRKSRLLPGAGVVTGGAFPCTGAPRTSRTVLWLEHTNFTVGVMSQVPGLRAAVSHLRVYRLDNDVPAPRGGRLSDERLSASGAALPADWEGRVRLDALRERMESTAADYVGLNRWLRLRRQAGDEALFMTAVGAGQAMYRTAVLQGYRQTPYDAVRLAALLCEKYGMRYVPEVSLGQPYFDYMVVSRGAAAPDDARAFSFRGLMGGRDVEGGALNALHPAVQDKVVAVYGELADRLRDSPAFAGISTRLTATSWNGHLALTGLYWGYGDWTVSQFEKETQIRVPGWDEDPRRFEERFRFLTAEGMQSKWNDWRCARIASFYRRLRDRVKASRRDLIILVSGDGRLDGLHHAPDTRDPRQRFRPLGLDPDLLRREDGIVLVPPSLDDPDGRQPGRVAARFPALLRAPPPSEPHPMRPFLNAPALLALAVGGSDAALDDSSSYHADWDFTPVLTAPSGRLDLDLHVPAPGPYRLVIGHVARQPGAVLVSVNGRCLLQPAVVTVPGEPEQSVFDPFSLSAGKVQLSLLSPSGFGVYGLQLIPIMRPLPSPLWSTVGPFGGPWTPGGSPAAVKAGFLQVYPPEDDPDPAALYFDENDLERWWTQTDLAAGLGEDRGVNFGVREHSKPGEFCFAMTHIVCPDERAATFMLAAEGWAEWRLNGEIVESTASATVTDAYGCQAHGGQMVSSVLPLRKGVNTLLVKSMGSHTGNRFEAHISDQPDLQFTHLPPDPSP